MLETKFVEIPEAASKVGARVTAWHWVPSLLEASLVFSLEANFIKTPLN